MFDIGWSELLIIGIVALIVVGPKDLPGMFRTLGRFTGKMRGMAREFQRAMNQAADESGVKDISKEIKAAASPKKFGLDAVRSAAKDFQDDLMTGDNSSKKMKPAPENSISRERNADTEEKKTGDAKSESRGAGGKESAASVASEEDPAEKQATASQQPPSGAMDDSADADAYDMALSGTSSYDEPVAKSDEESRRAESDS